MIRKKLSSVCSSGHEGSGRDIRTHMVLEVTTPESIVLG
jgi:hypothetical protein